jgi:hypothetical protein
VTAGAIEILLLQEKNPDVRELLRLHRDVALRGCGHERGHYVGGPDYGDHVAPSRWCPDCKMWV